MRADWTEVEIADLCELNPRLKNKETISAELEVQFLPMALVEEVANKIQLTETRKFSEVQQKSYTYFAEGDVLFAKVTPCMENGKIAIAKGLKNQIGFGSSEFHVLRPSKAIHESFLFYFLVRSKFRNEAQHEMTGAVGLRRVPKQFLENYLISLPPLPEQRAIVARIEELFSELDHAVSSLQSAQAKLDIYRQAVLKKAFEGGFTEENTKKINDLPIGWNWIKSGDLFSFVTSGSRGWAKYYSDSGAIFIRITNLDFDTLDLNLNQDKIQHVSPPNDSEGIRTKVQEGDFLFSITGYLGMFAIAPKLDNAFVNQHVSLCRPKEGFNKRFVGYWLISKSGGLRYLNENKKGAVKAGLNLDDLKGIPIPMPNDSIIQEKIVQEIESRLSVADKLAETIQTNLQKSEALRQSILKKAFEGRLLSEAEVEACRKEANWEPAERLLERIKSEKIKVKK